MKTKPNTNTVTTERKEIRKIIEDAFSDGAFWKKIDTENVVYVDVYDKEKAKYDIEDKVKRIESLLSQKEQQAAQKAVANAREEMIDKVEKFRDGENGKCWDDGYKPCVHQRLRSEALDEVISLLEKGTK